MLIIVGIVLKFLLCLMAGVYFGYLSSLLDNAITRSVYCDTNTVMIILTNKFFEDKLLSVLINFVSLCGSFGKGMTMLNNVQSPLSPIFHKSNTKDINM